MPSKTRSGPAHQSMPWASGQRKPPPSGRRTKKQTPWTRLKRKAKRKLDHHPGLSLAAMILLGLVAIVAMILGLLAENLLFFLASGLTTLGAVAAARTQHLARQRQEQSTRIPKPPKTPRAQGPQPEPQGRQTSSVVVCTKTGKQVSPKDECPCPERHVTSERGERWYGLPLGSPITVGKGRR